MATPLALASPAPTDLLRQRQAELDALFSLLAPPSPAQAKGYWHGTLMAVHGLDWLPRALAGSLYRLLSTPLNPWRGKSFDSTSGANRWLLVHGAAFGCFTMHTTNSPVDGQPVLLLDYNVAGNPGLLRNIRGEARQLGNGQLLARMNWQGSAGLQRVLYFTLTRVD
ncbi:MAG: hypothetical protein PSX71_11135 [bacterium]|nr:hypothetical protein [bacterium]